MVRVVAQWPHSIFLAFIHHDGAVVTRALGDGDCPELILHAPERRVELFLAPSSTISTCNLFCTHEIWILMHRLVVVPTRNVAICAAMPLLVEALFHKITLDFVPAWWKVAIVATMVLM